MWCMVYNALLSLSGGGGGIVISCHNYVSYLLLVGFTSHMSPSCSSSSDPEPFDFRLMIPLTLILVSLKLLNPSSRGLLVIIGPPVNDTSSIYV